jgi:hypothetical protein
MSADPFAGRLADFAAGRLDADEAGRVLDHVETCPSCSAELDFLADVVATAERGAAAGAPGAVPLAAPAGPRRLRRLPFWMAGLAAAALVLFVVGPRWLAGARLADLADRSLPHWTATELRGADDDLLRDALQAYERGDRDVARSGLTAWLADHPGDAEASFWRAMTALADDDLAAADADLAVAVEHGSGFLRERARWRRAQVALLREDAAAARTLLEEIVAEDGEFARDARLQLERLAG